MCTCRVKLGILTMMSVAAGDLACMILVARVTTATAKTRRPKGDVSGPRDHISLFKRASMFVQRTLDYSRRVDKHEVMHLVRSFSHTQ